MLNSLKKAFTLIELLIVIGIMAVIAAGVVALIDPVEKTKQANDANFQNVIGTLATALQSYAAQQSDGGYVLSSSWTSNNSNPLVTTGELQTFPAMPTSLYSVTYLGGGTSATALYGPLQSKKYKEKCGGASGTPYWFWSSNNGRACGSCSVPNVNTTCATW